MNADDDITQTYMMNYLFVFYLSLKKNKYGAVGILHYLYIIKFSALKSFLCLFITLKILLFLKSFNPNPQP